MHANAESLRDFYNRFGRRDGQGMGAYYADDATFSDPVFPDLDAAGVRAMWKMLTARGKDLRIDLGAFEADEHGGRARWDAYYTFAATGRPVRNQVESRFEFRDGLIVKQVDSFDFWRWSRQALGPIGLLLGWSGWLRRKVQGNAARGLDEFMKKARG